MKNCRGSVNVTVLIGVILFVASFLFFLWLQYEGASNSSHLDSPRTEDETVALTNPGQLSRPEAINGKPEPANDKSQRPAAVQDAFTERNSVTELSDVPTVPDTAHPETEQVVYDEPLGDLTISGRVLTRSGKAVAGIEVTATATHLFEQGQRKVIPQSARRRQTTSAYGGAYAFKELANGEYQISTVATDRYARALIQVRAGVDFADLVVTGHQDIRVQGIVSTSEGEPIAGARVRANVPDAREVMTNRQGRYVFDVMLPDNVTALLVRANRDGYQDRQVQLTTGHSENAQALELNIVMQPDADSDLAEVAGTVTGPGREPAAGQRLQLSSAKVRQNYRSTTDTDGTFVFRGVEPGDDYTVSINATDDYQDYFQKNIEITENGQTLNIELLDRDTGVLRGQMVNILGNAVADFSLVLQTTATSYYSQQVIGDASGNFVVEKAPAGELLLKTKSTPYYSVEGIRLAANAEQQITVVLDWGYDEIHGRVVNDDGYPVAVPNISLTWSHQQNGIRTTARRTAAADEQGNFRFTQLGPGNHRLTINAAGYKPASLNHDVAMQGSDLVVELATK